MAEGLYARIYSHREFYTAIVMAVRAIGYLASARRKKLLSPQFIERVMLAVTEVNGCEVCSWAHTKMALEQGMSADEIKELLSGNTGNVPQEEAVAVMFAQHYAHEWGKPSARSWQRLTGQYGRAKALGILGAARVMHAANIYGIAISAMGRRLRGRPVAGVKPAYEVSIALAILVYLPIGTAHALLSPQAQPPGC